MEGRGEQNTDEIKHELGRKGCYMLCFIYKDIKEKTNIFYRTSF